MWFYDVRADGMTLDDKRTPIEANDFIRRKVPGAQLTILDAAHISNIEQAAAFNAEVLGFLTS